MKLSKWSSDLNPQKIKNSKIKGIFSINQQISHHLSISHRYLRPDSRQIHTHSQRSRYDERKVVKRGLWSLPKSSLWKTACIAHRNEWINQNFQSQSFLSQMRRSLHAEKEMPWCWWRLLWMLICKYPSHGIIFSLF